MQHLRQLMTPRVDDLENAEELEDSFWGATESVSDSDPLLRQIQNIITKISAIESVFKAWSPRRLEENNKIYWENLSNRFPYINSYIPLHKDTQLENRIKYLFTKANKVIAENIPAEDEKEKKTSRSSTKNYNILVTKYNILVSKCNKLTYTKLEKEYNDLVQEIQYINNEINLMNNQNEGWI